ncbi:MAG: transposase [Methanosarcinales archaeon]
MQETISHPGLKIHLSGELSVKTIFEDNRNWDVFYFLNKDEIREVEFEEVQKMMACKDGSRGFFVYWCEDCKDHRIVYFGCNSRLCSNCGKNHTDKWAKSLSKAMFNVPHRHAVLTITDKLWPIIRRHRELLKALMDAAIHAINDTLSYSLRRKILAGAIVVLHPFSRNLGFNPHLHVLITEGGFDKSGNFIHKRYIPFKALRRTWQYQVLTRFKEALPRNDGMSKLIDRLFKSYPDGFYIYTPEESRITSKRKIAEYVARYIRHPAIANSRICGYDGKDVTFWYQDNEEVKHYRTMEVFEFIQAVIQHIPDRQFKMIRYYGAYCRKWKREYAAYLEQGSITQTTLDNFPKKRVVRCQKCGSRMKFVMYFGKGPPKKEVFGSKIGDWAYISAS